MSQSNEERGVTRRELLKSIATLAAGATAASAATPAPVRPGSRAQTPPNVVFILSDNHRWDAMGAAGHPFVRTPHMDRIGREGLHFENAFCTTPLCSPARASFLTGLYAWKHGVHSHAARASWDDAHTTFLELLAKHAGYRTAFIGKWHMPGSGLPRLRGVDRFVTFTTQDGQGRYFDCPLVVDGEPAPSRRPYLTEELTDRAIEFIDERGDAPFCLYLSHKAVHHPWKPAPDLVGLYADAPVELPPGANRWTGFANGMIWGGVTRPIEGAIRTYMETVTALDREIGRLLDHLDDEGLADDTLVIYASDNGFLFGEHEKVELRWPFEEVIRIPLLLRHPRLVSRAGRRVSQMALNIDVAPTLLELAGVAVPPEMHGTSLAPLLRDPAAPGRRAWLVENYRGFPYRVPAYQGVRTTEHLYVEYEGPFAPTLHDVRRDPTQTTDLMGTPEGERLRPELTALLDGLRRGERFDA